MRDVQTKFPKGKIVRDRYIVEDLLGKGGFGAVYRVRDRRGKDNVFALKELIDPDAHERENFAFECEILKRLDHRALPRVYRVFEDNKNNSFYMLMDYIEGPNLEKLRQRQAKKRFSLVEVMKIMASIIDAVSYLHAQQPPIIHRDIKPSNIIVPSDDHGAVLVDFGIAKEYDQDATTTAIRHCSPGYGAPEQYMHGTNTRTDIYGLGATFYTLLTGTVPADALYRITRLGSNSPDPLEAPHLLVPTIPVSIALVLQRAMAINSEERFTSVEEFWDALQTASVQETSEDKTSLASLSDEINRIDETNRIEPQNNQGEDALKEGAPEPEVGTSSQEMQSTSAQVSPQVQLATLPPPRISFYKAKQPFSTGQKRLLLLFLLLLSLGTLLAGSTVFTAHLGALHPPKPLASPRSSGTRVPISSVATPVPTRVPRVPTPAPPSYPQLANAYNGTISDTQTTPPTTTTLSLSHVQQQGKELSGNITAGPGLLLSNTFTGTVSPDHAIQFLVPSYFGLLPLHFEGHIQADGSMSGTYCGYENGQCNTLKSGYGTWSLASR